MKRMVLFLLLTTFVAAVCVIAAEETKQPLRPAQKIMQERAALLKGMNKNLAEGKFNAVAQSANVLAAETKSTSDKLPNPLAKDITRAVSALATETSEAAMQKDNDAVKMKLGALKGKCDECHAKIRDKK